MRDQLPWYLAGPAVGLAILLLLAAGNRRFGITGGLTDALSGRVTWRVWLVAGVAAGSLVHALTAGGLETDADLRLARRQALGRRTRRRAVRRRRPRRLRRAHGRRLHLRPRPDRRRARPARELAAIAAIMGSAIAASLVLRRCCEGVALVVGLGLGSCSTGPASPTRRRSIACSRSTRPTSTCSWAAPSPSRHRARGCCAGGLARAAHGRARRLERRPDPARPRRRRGHLRRRLGRLQLVPGSARRTVGAGRVPALATLAGACCGIALRTALTRRAARSDAAPGRLAADVL